MRKFVVNRATVSPGVQKLMISLQIPLSLTAHEFTLFKVITLPMLVDDNKLHTSIITNMPEYIGWHQYSDWYLEFPSAPRFENGLFYLHHNPQTLYHVSQPTCIVALLILERNEILQLCKFAVQPFTAPSAVIVIGPGQLVLQNINNYTLIQDDQPPSTHTGCGLCVLRLACRSTFIAMHYKFYSQIAHCVNESNSGSSVSYAVNLILLTKYFDTTTLVKNNSELLNTIPRIILPNMTFHLEQTYRELGIFQHSLIDLDVAVQATLNDSKLFLSASDKITSEFQPLTFDGSNLAQQISHLCESPAYSSPHSVMRLPLLQNPHHHDSDGFILPSASPFSSPKILEFMYRTDGNTQPSYPLWKNQEPKQPHQGSHIYSPSLTGKMLKSETTLFASI